MIRRPVLRRFNPFSTEGTRTNGKGNVSSKNVAHRSMQESNRRSTAMSCNVLTTKIKHILRRYFFFKILNSNHFNSIIIFFLSICIHLLVLLVFVWFSFNFLCLVWSEGSHPPLMASTCLIRQTYYLMLLRSFPLHLFIVFIVSFFECSLFNENLEARDQLIRSIL